MIRVRRSRYQWTRVVTTEIVPRIIFLFISTRRRRGPRKAAEQKFRLMIVGRGVEGWWETHKRPSAKANE
jgi:hypothetical protein